MYVYKQTKITFGSIDTVHAKQTHGVIYKDCCGGVKTDFKQNLSASYFVLSMRNVGYTRGNEKHLIIIHESF